MSNIIHYETLWEDAEKLSKEENSIFVLDNLTNLILEYKDILESNADEKTKFVFKNRKFGEILFSLCELSKIDNVNTYSALKQEIELKNIK